MISLMKLIGAEQDDSAGMLLRVLLLFLEGLALHAVDLEPLERAHYQEAIRNLGRRIEETARTSDLMVLAGECIKTNEQYNRGIEKFVRCHAAEMNAIFSMMSQALIRVSADSAQAAKRLREIEQKLGRTAQIEDIRVIRATLAESLKGLCEEAERQDRQSCEMGGHADNLRDMHRGTPGGALGGDVDRVTGLPSANSALQYLRSVADAEQGIYILVLCLERLDTINGRFGFQIGDQALLCFSQHLAAHLSPKDQLFRWRGPCFVAILQRPYGLDMVRSEAAKIGSSRVEYSVEIGTRSVLLTLSAAWAIIPISRPSDVTEAGRRIDGFTAQQSRTPAGVH